MARRCKLAKEYNWPKRVVLQRFHDDFLRCFESYRSSTGKHAFYTKLNNPCVICCKADFISTPLFRAASKVKCLPHVWAEPDGTCTLFMDGRRD